MQLMGSLIQLTGYLMQVLGAIALINIADPTGLKPGEKNM